MSYKKIVAGVATFAVAASMVVPAAFAAPLPSDAKAAADAVEQAKQDYPSLGSQLDELKTAADAAKVEDPQVSKVEDFNKKLATVNAEIAKLDKAAEEAKKLADAKADLQKAIDAAKKVAAEKPAVANQLNKVIKDAEEVLADGTKGAAELKAEAKKVNEAADKLSKDLKANTDYKQKLIDDVLAKGRVALDQLGWFNDGSAKVTVGDKVYTIDRLAEEIREYMAKVEDENFVKNNTVTVEGYVAWLNKAIDALNDKLVKTDKAALTPKGVKAQEEQAKKAAKGTKKAGKLPKTGEQAPVAPFAAAGAAALIAAGLVASRKVNA